MIYSNPRASLILLLLSVVCFSQPSYAETTPAHIDGWLIIDWGDPSPDSLEKPVRQFFLGDATGYHQRLEASPELLRGPVSRWHGRKVRVFLEDEGQAAVRSTAPLRVAAVQLLGDDAKSVTRKAVEGSKPWVSLLCKFADISDEPENLSFFQGMYDNSSGRLDDYWREVSDDAINIEGSIAIDWVVLPNPHNYYVATPGNGTSANRAALFNDCTAAADAFVDFSNGGNPFVGINLMFNAELDCCAWGGARSATLDGVTKMWRATWEPPWAFADLSVIEHEMGHGFGLTHSTNWDNDGFAYDNPWDVMSADRSYSPRDDTYGRIGKHIIGYHKDLLGWIPAEQKLVVEANESATIVLDDTGHNDTANYRLVKLPLGDGTWYYIEARKRRGVYESDLPGEAVLIFHVDPTRPEPAWLFDADAPPAGFADTEGSMWRAGEVFEDATSQIRIFIESETVDGFQITIDRGNSLVFLGGFESGDLLGWSSVESQ